MLHRLKNDFRLSIITLLGASAVLGITPFAVLRFLQGNTMAGLLDTVILAGISFGVIYSWLTGNTRRSEEHTSELQSRPHLVCRLLLEKKKKNKQNNTIKNKKYNIKTSVHNQSH